MGTTLITTLIKGGIFERCPGPCLGAYAFFERSVGTTTKRFQSVAAISCRICYEGFEGANSELNCPERQDASNVASPSSRFPTLAATTSPRRRGSYQSVCYRPVT